MKVRRQAIMALQSDCSCLTRSMLCRRCAQRRRRRVSVAVIVANVCNCRYRAGDVLWDVDEMVWRLVGLGRGC